MKKVYLVYMRGITKSDNYAKQVWGVFTNKRKAQIYCKYRKELTTNEWLQKFKMEKVNWIIEEELINNNDYTSDLKEIQEEKLLF